ncbi:MAG: hypothetical protein QM790_04325 [Nibricoccus sp.]
MKLHIIASSILIASAAYAAAPQDRQTASPEASVYIQSEAHSLANGFAQASNVLTRPPVTMALQREGVVRLLEDIKSIRSSDGVLIVEVGKGIIYIVNPKDVIYVTDGYQLKAQITSPNKAQSPTPTSVTPPATPEPRQP